MFNKRTIKDVDVNGKTAYDENDTSPVRQNKAPCKCEYSDKQGFGAGTF